MATTEGAALSRTPRDRHEYRNSVLSAYGPTSASARLVALALAQCMDGKTMESRAGQPLLTRLTALSERTVRDALTILRSEGWLQERPGAKPWQRIRRAVIPDDVPADSAGTRSANGSAAPANSAGRAPAITADAPADSAAGTGKKALVEAANSAGDPVLGPVPDPVQDPDAASPAPANAVSAALEEKADEVMRLHGNGLTPAKIAKRMRDDWRVMCNANEVSRLIARATAPS
jgi:hypothetical protein